MNSRVCISIVWIATLVLLTIGLMMVTSTSPWVGDPKNQYLTLKKQAAFGCLGLCMAVFVAWFDYRKYRDYIWWIYGIVGLLLLLCFVPGIGQEINGERRWLRFLGIQFQPSELGKVMTIIVLSHWFAKFRAESKTLWKGFIFPGIIFCIPLGLILFEKDMGTAAALAAAGFCLFFFARVRLVYIFSSLALAALALTFLVKTNGNRMERIRAWRNPEAYRYSVGLQQYRAEIALGNGGLTGVGLGNSAEKHGYLPFAHTDFIFAPLGEELGVRGTLLVLLCYTLILIFAIGVAMQARDYFGRLVAAGIACIIIWPAILNVAVVTSLVPNSGLPLPLISCGGTNLIFVLTSIGLLTSVQRRINVSSSEEEDPLSRILEEKPAIRL